MAPVLLVVSLPASTYHYWDKKIAQPDRDQQLRETIRQLFQERKGDYGYRRIHLSLRNTGYLVNHKKVQRIMQEEGLFCTKFSRKSRTYRSYKGTVGKVAKNSLGRRFYTSVPRQKLVTDVTELKYGQGKKLYLSPYIDLFNGEVVSFSISKRPTLSFAMEALEGAIEAVKHAPYRTTIHTDQGWHYQHTKWVRTLRKNKIFQSMSRKGNCLDNAPAESFFALLKQERYHGVHYETYKELKTMIEDYIDDYNHHRIKQKLGGRSPVSFREHVSPFA